VIAIGGDGTSHGEPARKVVGGWSNKDLKGQPLRISRLSTRLTKVTGYRRTICAIEAQQYLLRRINGIREPLLAQCEAAWDTNLRATSEAVMALDWRDFEILVDLFFLAVAGIGLLP
jgi:hypothetical protein